MCGPHAHELTADCPNIHRGIGTAVCKSHLPSLQYKPPLASRGFYYSAVSVQLCRSRGGPAAAALL